QNEGSSAQYVFTATLSHASQGVTTITTDKGVITIADGETTGTLKIDAANGEDVYKDGSELVATITGVNGPGFEKLEVKDGSGSATAKVVDTETASTVSLSGSVQNEGPSAQYVFTATLSHASQGVTTITTDKGVITIADGETTGTLKIDAANGEDVYKDGTELVATITGVDGPGFEKLEVKDGSATAKVVDTETASTVSLSGSVQSEGSTAQYVFTATLSHASQGVTTITTDKGVITIADGETTGTLKIDAANGEDVYKDGTELVATITGVDGPGFEKLEVKDGSATAKVVDTETASTVSLSGSVQNEGPSAQYVFTATLSHASQGVTTITTDKGVITIADGETTGTLKIDASNGEDVYKDGSELVATITGVNGPGFEKLEVKDGSGSATAKVVDTETASTVSLSGSVQNEGPSAQYVFTATLSHASQGVTTITTDKGVITIADGETTGTLKIDAANGEDVYKDGSELVATITGVDGPGFEKLEVKDGSATAKVVDTETASTVSLSGSIQNEGPSAQYVFTATLSHASQGVTTITTDKGVITIADGETTGTLKIDASNGEDVYKDGSELVATITGVDGPGFEKLEVKDGSATAKVVDTETASTVSLSGSVQSEGPSAQYVFTATLSHASQGVTTITTDKGVITIADGETTGTLKIDASNGEDVYKDGSELVATITGVDGPGFEKLEIKDGSGSATAKVVDTETASTVSLSGSVQNEGPSAQYVFTATLSHASQGVTTITTDKGVITIADGETTGTLKIDAANGEDVYKDGSELVATITGVNGPGFEKLEIKDGSATAKVVDTETASTVSLSGSVQNEGPSAQYVFTATLSHASQGVTTITTDKGVITIADGQTTGTLEIAAGNGEDVYVDGSSLTATITGVNGPGFESLGIKAGSGSATSTVVDTPTPSTVSLSGSQQFEGPSAQYIFTATLSHASKGVTTITTDKGVITIADGATTGTLKIDASNGEDVYTDGSSLTATITGVNGPGFESLGIKAG
ncbi:immunoglobulin-like domain-containing protein, partial [Pseudomonas alkylphenolica]|nr:hypothetical protein [Pseudomonas alkylphenolica]